MILDINWTFCDMALPAVEGLHQVIRTNKSGRSTQLAVYDLEAGWFQPCTPQMPIIRELYRLDDVTSWAPLPRLPLDHKP